MGRVRIVWGTGTGPTALSSYDGALAAAGIHDYNLLRVSSVLPVDTDVERAGRAPDLGPVGGRLTVVEARETVRRADLDSGPDADSDPDYIDSLSDAETADRTAVCAGLGWAQATNGRGIVYEATGTDAETVHRTIESGLRAGCVLREFSPTCSERVVLSTDGTAERVETGDGTAESDSDLGSGEPRRTPTLVDHPEDGTYLTAVVLAVYGESEPIV